MLTMLIPPIPFPSPSLLSRVPKPQTEPILHSCHSFLKIRFCIGEKTCDICLSQSELFCWTAWSLIPSIFLQATYFQFSLELNNTTFSVSILWWIGTSSDSMCWILWTITNIGCANISTVCWLAFLQMYGQDWHSRVTW
jgi:hypothetical protein